MLANYIVGWFQANIQRTFERSFHLSFFQSYAALLSWNLLGVIPKTKETIVFEGRKRNIQVLKNERSKRLKYFAVASQKRVTSLNPLTYNNGHNP